jgi:hypothetical protein
MHGCGQSQKHRVICMAISGLWEEKPGHYYGDNYEM